MKISESEYIKIHADFCNKLGKYVIDNNINRGHYIMTLGYLKKTLPLALASIEIRKIMTAYLERVDCPVEGVGVPLIPVFLDFGYRIQDLRIIESLIRNVNFNYIFF